MSAPSSSKIKKKIRTINFLPRGKTQIVYAETYQPRNQQELITDEIPLKRTMARHGKFNRCMERFCVHLMVRLGLSTIDDRTKTTFIGKEYFDDSIFEEDERFNNITITGIEITSKDDSTIFKIKGFLTTTDGEVAKLPCPSINLLKVEGGYNYPLQDLAKDHLDALLIEAEEYLNFKTDQLAIPFDKVA